MLTGYHQKSKEDFQKRLRKVNKVFLKKKRRSNMLVSNIEFFLKKKRKTNIKMVVSDTKIF